MKKSILLWKMGKLSFAVALIGAVTYFSLKGRIEQEHGPGSWEEWLRATPEVDQGEMHSSASPPARPRNIKARFWTGVPRVRDVTTVRLDRYGYSTGYSKADRAGLWYASYLTGKTAKSPPPEQMFRKWEADPELKNGELAEDRPLRSSFARGHFVSPALVGQAYGWNEDTWMKSNGFQAPAEFTRSTWPSVSKLIEKYSRVYGGLVCFVIPIRQPRSADLSEIAVVMVRPSPRGPTTFSFSVPSSSTGEIKDLSVFSKSVAEIEEKSGVYLFADLPPEWRSFLLHPSQNKPWPLGG